MFTKTDPDNPFRNHSNKLYAKALFLEESLEPSVVRYTLKNHDYKGYPSLYLLYMAKADLDEYNFAKTYFEGWRHWEQLCNTEWFKPYVLAWREEFALKKQTEAINRIRAIAESSGKDALAANKYIAERAWEKGQTTLRRGRPNKVEDARLEAAKIKAEDSQLDSDFDRIVGNG